MIWDIFRCKWQYQRRARRIVSAAAPSWERDTSSQLLTVSSLPLPGIGRQVISMEQQYPSREVDMLKVEPGGSAINILNTGHCIQPGSCRYREAGDIHRATVPSRELDILTAAQCIQPNSYRYGEAR